MPPRSARLLRRVRSLAVAIALATSSAANAAIVLQPSAEFAWDPAPGNPLSYNVYIDYDGEPPSEDAQYTVSQPRITLELPAGERFTLRVAALYAPNIEGPASPRSDLLQHRTPLAPRADLDGDGRGDLVLAQATAGASAVWLMDEAGALEAGQLPTLHPSYEYAGSADFDGDGRDEIAWTNPFSGKLDVWTMDGVSRISVRTIASRGPGWRARVLSDLTPEGWTRVVWTNERSGAVDLWLVDGTQAFASVVAFSSLGSFSGPANEWRLERGCDLDGDGRRELIWARSGAAPEYRSWFVDDNGVGERSLDVGGARIVGCGDFAHEAGEGLVLEESDRRITAWHAAHDEDGVLFGEATALASNRGLAFASANDFDGDGDLDLLYWSTASGRAQLITLDRMDFAGSQRFRFNPQPIAPRE